MTACPTRRRARVRTDGGDAAIRAAVRRGASRAPVRRGATIAAVLVAASALGGPASARPTAAPASASTADARTDGADPAAAAQDDPFAGFGALAPGGPAEAQVPAAQSKASAGTGAHVSSGAGPVGQSALASSPGGAQGPDGVGAPENAQAGSALGATAAEATAPATWTIQGSGAGHGVGMSQYGALEMAKAGWPAARIAKFYYQGATVGQANDAVTIVVNLQSSVTAPSLSISALASGGGSFQVSAGGETMAGGAGQSITFARSGAGVTATCSGCPGTTSVTGDSATLRFADGKTLARLGSDGYDVGTIQVVPSSGDTGTVEVLARLRLHDEYLDRLAEVPWAWPAAAQQAQAMAGRAYALSKVKDGLRSSCQCHVYDDTRDQVYAGYPSSGALPYWAAWRAAVDAGATATTGPVPRVGDDVVRAYYSASNGGWTRSSAEVWGTSISYLRARPDPWSTKPGNPYLRWTETVSAAALAGATGVDSVTRLDLTARHESRAVRSVRAYDGAGASHTVSGDDFAGRLGLPSAWLRRQVSRVAASDQMSLAATLARSVPATARAVVLTSSDPAKLADTVAAPPLAKAVGAPLLLTDEYALPLSTVRELNRRAKSLTTAYLLGGEASISSRVEEQLQNRGLTVVRLGGADRYQVAAAVARRVAALRRVTNVVVVGGNSLPDAVAVGGAAAVTGSPILFSRRDQLAPETAAFIDRVKPRTAQVLGGEASVSGSVVHRLQQRRITTLRLGGEDRYAVSGEVARFFSSRLPGTKLVVAAGDGNYLMDGLLGAALGRPTLLVAHHYLPGRVLPYLQSLHWVRAVTVIGSTSRVDAETLIDVSEA